MNAFIFQISEWPIPRTWHKLNKRPTSREMVSQSVNKTSSESSPRLTTAKVNAEGPARMNVHCCNEDLSRADLARFDFPRFSQFPIKRPGSKSVRRGPGSSG